MRVPLQRRALASALSLVLFAPAGALAQNAGDKAADDAASKKEKAQLETVLVTGSNIKRATVEGASPVVTITSEQMKIQGFSTVFEALSSVSQTAGGSMESNIQWGSHTPNAYGINIRGLGPGRTLVLIDGVRVADYPLPYGGESTIASYNNIPAAGVDRIEILASGASAIYGSDAVAGVVNIILKKNYSGDEARVKAGTSTRGGRDLRDINFAGGKTGDNWSLNYAFEAYNRDYLPMSERPYIDSQLDPLYSSWDFITRKQGINIARAILLRRGDGSYVTPPNGACGRFARYVDTQRHIYSPATGKVNNVGSYCGDTAVYSDWALRDGNKVTNAVVGGSYRFNDSLEAFGRLIAYKATGSYLYSDPASQVLNGARWFDPGITDAAHPDGTLMGIGQRFIAANEFGGVGNIMNKTYERSTDLIGGLRGRIFNDRYDWELTLNRSDYHVRESIPSLIQSKYDTFFLGQQLGTTADGTPIYRLNQDRWWNPMSVSDFNSFMTRSINRSNSYNEGAKALVRGDLFDAWAGPIGFAAFAEWGRQGYDLNPDPRAIAGDYYVNNVDQGGGDRNRWAAGGEVLVPLTSQINLDLATRYDNYDAVASQGKQTYMAKIEYRPLENLLLRGSYATSFRAPDMAYTYARASTAYQSFIDQYACVKAGQTGHCGGQDGPFWTSFVPIYGNGRQDLLYETGHSWTYGFVWDAFDGFSLSTDYWHVSLKNEIRRIDSGTMLTADAGCSFGVDASGAPYTTFASDSGYCKYIKDRIQRDASGRIIGMYPGPINQASDIFSGVDVEARYRLDTERFGNFTFGLRYTDVLKHLNQPTINDPLKNIRRQDVRVITNFTTTWQIGKFETAMLINRTGSTPSVRAGGCTPFDDGNVPSQAQGCTDTDPNSPDYGKKTTAYWGRVGPFYNVNLSVGYNVNEHARVNLYANNVFNKVPSKDPYKFDFQFIPDRQGNPVGTELALELVYKF